MNAPVSISLKEDKINGNVFRYELKIATTRSIVMLQHFTREGLGALPDKLEAMAGRIRDLNGTHRTKTRD